MAHQPGPVELAKLGLTSLIATSSGALVALLSFAAQSKPVGDTKLPFMWGVAGLGLGLVLALWSTLFAYLSEVRLANDEGEKPWWTVAFVLAIGGFISSTIGFGAAGWALWCFVS